MVPTRNLQGIDRGFVRRTISEVATPPPFLEYTWFASLFYAYLGQAWGIVIPAVGGMILVLVAVICWLTVGGQAVRLYKPVAWCFYTVIAILAIQVLFHHTTGEAWSEATALVQWLALLFIVQVLSLRQKFLHHFALVALVIGVASLPYINLKNIDGVVRAWASGTGLANPNALGMWFGFCTVYFVFWGFQCREPMLKVASWAVAIGCLYVVMLTVSRAPLLAIVLACVVGFRSEMKRSFVPILSLVLLACLIYVSGIFDEGIGYYTARGASESGREKLWSRALERIVDSPWVGSGLGDIRIETRDERFVNPHNPLLHIALGAGIIPVICFLGYLVRVAIGVRRIMQSVQVGEAALLPPLIAFGLFETMQADYTFMSPWIVVVFGFAAGAGMVAKAR